MNKWFKYALISITGIAVTILALTILNPNNGTLTGAANRSLGYYNQYPSAVQQPMRGYGYNWMNYGNNQANNWMNYGNNQANGWMNYGNNQMNGWMNYGNNQMNGWMNYGMGQMNNMMNDMMM